MAQDYFSLFDLPRTLLIDTDALQETFHALSRKFHPDLYQNTMPRVQRQILRQSMLLNEAYNTLRDRRQRLLYLLDVERPERNAEARSNRVPLALFDIVEQAHDLLFELQGLEGEEREAVKKKLNGIRAEALEAQEAMWNALYATGKEWDNNERAHELVEIDDDAYGATKSELLERLETQNNDLSYVERLIENIDKAIEGRRDA